MKSDALKVHSKWGIASFIIFCLCMIMAAIVLSMDIMSIFDNGINPTVNSADVSIWSVRAIGILNFIGTILGLAGIFQSKTKKTFSVLGLILNGVITLWIIKVFLPTLF
ncbi:MAG: hypothetical protein ACOYWZ_12755 [Bacillota bacterium]